MALITLWGTLAAKAAPTGVISVSEGPPISIIRGDKLFDATKGATLQPGDFVETGAANFVVVELPGGAVVAFGPSSRLLLLQSTTAAFAVLRGWVKVDAHEAADAPLQAALGLRLGASARHGVFVLHATDQRDEVFLESGEMTLLLHDEKATRSEREVKVTQFLTREDRNPVVTAPRPASAFVTAMPRQFRDPLPDGLFKGSKARVTEPKLVREVSYADVADWLTIPHEWRAGFINRFRGRLKDPAFFSAMDARLALHPEWTRVLHPPPPPPPPDEVGPTPKRSDAASPNP